MNKKLLFITNTSLAKKSGGWPLVAREVYDQLSINYKCSFIDEINPPVNKWDKLVSALQRKVGLKGDFVYFSTKRLNRINQDLDTKISDDCIVFFHGSTPWIKLSMNQDYFCLLDASFHTYINIYHQADAFNKEQVEDIVKQEILFLNKAKAVFFTSDYALKETTKLKDINSSRFYNVGLGGFNLIPGPSTDSKYFLFIAYDFYAKGGISVCEAFIKLNKLFADYKLIIIGGKPDKKYLQHPKIVYKGFINRNVESEAEILRQLYLNATALVLPTTQDMTPLVILEAASVGCPSISIKKFGIPELIIDGKTGLLLEPTFTNLDLYSKMQLLITNPGLRNELSHNAINLIKSKYNWNTVGNKIIAAMA